MKFTTMALGLVEKAMISAMLLIIFVTFYSIKRFYEGDSTP